MLADARNAQASSLHCEVTDYLWPWTAAVPVVMVHGFCRNTSVWTRWLPALSERHRIYRADLPGMGRSPLLPGGYTWDGMQAAFLELFDRNSLDRVHWVGESSGAMIGALLASAHPERFASVVLVEMPLRRSPSLKKEHNLGQTSYRQTIAAHGLEEYCRRTVDARLDTTKASPDMVEWYVQQIVKTPGDVSVDFKEFVDTLDVEPSLRKLTMPVFLLCGDKSRVITPDQVEIMRRDLPNVEVQIFDGYGHGLNVLRAETCARAALDFWERSDTR